MVMRSMRQGAKGGILKFFLFGILVMAVGGLVLMDVGGFFRGGVARGDIAKVGSIGISLSEFDRTVRRTLSRVGISPDEAYRLGYLNEILSSELRNALLHQAAMDAGIKVGKETVALQIAEMVEPMAQGGETPQNVLNRILLSQGMSERDFIQTLRREVAGNILTGAVQEGLSTVPDGLVKDMYIYNNEKRDLEILVFPDADMKRIMAPTGEQLHVMYEALKEQNFAIPETREVSLVLLDSKKLAEDARISEEQLRRAYEDNIDLYSVPEERLVEQAVVKSEEDARAIFDLVQNETALETAVQEITGSTASYLGEAEYQKEGLLKEIGNLVFNAGEGDIIGPAQTPLGWHVLAVKKILPPEIKPFADVKDDLKEELQQLRIADRLYESANLVDDLLAGGASLEEIKKEADIETIDLGSFNVFGQNEKGNDALQAYNENRDIIIKTAFELFEGETSAMMEMPDGKFIAVHVKSITEKSYRPFDEVKGDIEKKWMADQRSLNNRMQTQAFLTLLEAGEKSLADIAKEQGKSVRTVKAVTRGGEAPEPLTQQARNILFEIPEGEYAMLPVEGGSAVAHVTDIKLPQRNAISQKETEKLRAEIKRGAGNEALMMYLESKRLDYGVQVNTRLLDTVYGAQRETF